MLIAGCGDVGAALGLELAAEGTTVFGLRRNPSKLPAALRPLTGDLGSPETLRDLPGDLDAVVYAAAADRTEEAAYQTAYVDGVRHLLAALETQGQQPRSLLFTSSTGVYGQNQGEWVDETSPTEPRRFTGRQVLAGEALIAAAPWPSTAVRFGGIYGPGRTRLLQRVAAGGLVVDRSRPAYTNRIHRDDCAGVLAHLLRLGQMGRALPPILVGVDHEPAPRHEVYDWLADQLAVPRPTEATGETVPAIHGGSKRCRNQRLLDFDYRFRYLTYREGYAPLVASLGRV